MHPDETMSPAEQRCGQRQHEEWRQNLRSWWSRVSVKRRLRPAKRKARAKLRTKHRDHPAGGVSMAGQGHAAQLSTTTAADPGSASAATPSAPRTEEEEVDEMVQHMVQNDPEAMAAQWEELLDRQRAIGTPDVMLEGDSKLFDSRTQQPHKWKIGQYFPLVNELCQLLDEQPPALYVFRLEDLKQIGGQPDQVGYRITFKSGTKPEYVHQYKLAEQEKEYVSKWLKELVDAGIVSESNSPWGAPLVLAPKKDAEGKWSKVRVAVDLRRLNRWIEWDGFPPSDPEETLRRASGWKWMSVCDCSSAFYQIPVGDEETRQALSFTAALPGEGARQWSFNRMCFGSKDAPACWNRLIRRALGDLEEWSGSRMPRNMDQHPVLAKLSISTDTSKIRGRVLCYADDLCIMANTPEDHLVLLQLVFQRLTDFGIQLAPPKMNMGVQRANFLGHVCGESGVEPMHDKMQGIEDMKEPRTVSEVRSFLGCVGYYVDHLSGWHEFKKVLTKLTRKNVRFEWGPEQQLAFDETKRLMKSAEVLRPPQWDQTFYLHTDWSEQGVGCALTQIQDGREVAILFGSRVNNDAQAGYHAYLGEIDAALWSIEHCRYYLRYRPFMLITDCAVMKWLTTTAELKGQLARWYLRLAEYDVSIQHRAGRLNHVDYLSRYPGGEAQPDEDKISLTKRLRCLDCEEQKEAGGAEDCSTGRHYGRAAYLAQTAAPRQTLQHIVSQTDSPARSWMVSLAQGIAQAVVGWHRQETLGHADIWQDPLALGFLKGEQKLRTMSGRDRNRVPAYCQQYQWQDDKVYKIMGAGKFLGIDLGFTVGEYGKQATKTDEYQAALTAARGEGEAVGFFESFTQMLSRSLPEGLDATLLSETMVQWKNFWIFPAIMAAAVFVLFLALFFDKSTSAANEVEGEAAESEAGDVS